MYCVYLTIYFGKKLPKRYIGSTKIEKIKSGYKGSVKSKIYKELWKNELIENPRLFKTRILSIHASHQEAIEKEKYLHIKYNVVKSDTYINMSIASPKGFFGRKISKENHPFFGKKHSEETKIKISNKIKLQYSLGNRVSPFLKNKFNGEKNGFFGKKHSEETKFLMKKPKRHVPKWSCPICSKSNLDGGNFVLHMRNKHNMTKEESKNIKNLIKPEGWVGPSHKGNYGLLEKAF